jgi:hypothetical protein
LLSQPYVLFWLPPVDLKACKTCSTSAAAVQQVHMLLLLNIILASQHELGLCKKVMRLGLY